VGGISETAMGGRTETQDENHVETEARQEEVKILKASGE
jgi:hypothetical protein